METLETIETGNLKQSCNWFPTLNACCTPSCRAFKGQGIAGLLLSPHYQLGGFLKITQYYAYICLKHKQNGMFLVFYRLLERYLCYWYRNMIMYRVFRKKGVFFTNHCNPSLAYIAVRDLQSSQRNASVQSLLFAGNFLYNQ